MLNLIGSEKQIKWAESIRAEYYRLVEMFGGEKIDCEDAKFWIEHGRVSNISMKSLPDFLIAYSWVKEGLSEDDMYDLAESDEDKYTKALKLVLGGWVK